MQSVYTTDTLIIGTGIAGLSLAHKLASSNKHQVMMLSSSTDILDSNSSWAQGGIIASGVGDHPELLIQDVLTAGAGVSLPAAANLLAKKGPDLVHKVLIDDCEIQFDLDQSGKLDYGLEAAHSARRILHVGDKTGISITEGLWQFVKQANNIQVFNNTSAIELITLPHTSNDPLDRYQDKKCVGVYALDQSSGQVIKIIAKQTVLATGGLGRLFVNTTNTQGARGDGLAMAWRAGVRIENAEYVQFHPTSFHQVGAPHFLISEAVRGEGAILKSPDTYEPFMEKYAPKWKDLAPRDVVARAIHHEMLNNGYEHVLLDIASVKSADFLHKRFPGMIENCNRYGIDPTKEPIPVVPAAHYSCGGVLVNEVGETSLNGLYAIGEVSCTGLHGANRLASTSLLEGLVWGQQAAKHILQSTSRVVDSGNIPDWVYSGHQLADLALIKADIKNVQNIMWHYVGLARNQARLARAERELRHLFLEIDHFYRTCQLTDELIGLRNMVQTAMIVTMSARRNKVSRGTHFLEDSCEQQETSASLKIIKEKVSI